MNQINSLEILFKTIQETNQFFISRVQKQVNVAMTLRNWLIGCHIVEYEQLGEDRAIYGKKVLETLAVRLKEHGNKGLAETNLKLFRQFYAAYPQIRQTLSDELKPVDLQHIKISQTLSDKSTLLKGRQDFNLPTSKHISLLINNLSFSHFIELIKAESATKRLFYEVQAIKNNWGGKGFKESYRKPLI